ncbi:coiled-coil-helix-coiled-coil-helix domain-containing protein 7 isoform X1 [Heteronotia binoei]|uniref:coiled-coil-helix-coiled-coil-helix domain-containing protein 7 isoform X1 n=1 Tax=Heteronotia binoei TaxID=13085 RepID=UPI0029316335|nr:coiled-coil-helix-coiled-coil-helix domain-containing protein 7 isoform X1 [Heteronotia binoei]
MLRLWSFLLGEELIFPEAFFCCSLQLCSLHPKREAKGLHESDASRKCMDDSNYNKDMCTVHFLRYKNCRKFWNGIMIQRRKDGIKPAMPTAEERKNILESRERIPY